MYCHHFPKTRIPTDEEWAQIESIANWVIENAPETALLPDGNPDELALRDTLITLHEFYETYAQELLDDEIPLEHSPSNVVQEFMGVPAIRLNGRFKAGAGFFTFTKDDPVNDRDQQVTHCNTERKPYDLLVCAMLALIDHQIPGLLELRSDGTPDDWADAINYAAGYDPSVPVPAGVYASNEGESRLSIPEHLDFRA